MIYSVLLSCALYKIILYCSYYRFQMMLARLDMDSVSQTFRIHLVEFHKATCLIYTQVLRVVFRIFLNADNDCVLASLFHRLE